MLQRSRSQERSGLITSASLRGRQPAGSNSQLQGLWSTTNALSICGSRMVHAFGSISSPMFVAEDICEVRGLGVLCYVIREQSHLYLIDSGFVGGVGFLRRTLNE